jgi:hypothetical protein
MKGIGLELNADKTNNIVVSGDQNTGRSLSMKCDYISLEILVEF